MERNILKEKIPSFGVWIGLTIVTVILVGFIFFATHYNIDLQKSLGKYKNLKEYIFNSGK